MRRLILGVALGVALAIAGLGVLGWLRAPLVAPARAGAMPAAVVPQAAVVEQALADAKKSGKAVAITLTFSERDLTLAAASYFPQNVAGATLTDPQVRLGSGRIVLECVAAVSVLRTTAVVVATPLVNDGVVGVRVDSATVAGMAVPDAVRAGLAGQLDQAIASGLPPGLQVTTVTVANKTLTVQGTANP